MEAPVEDGGLRERLRDIIFEADTPSGKRFDVLLLWAILLSVFAVVLESVEAIRLEFGGVLLAVEWGFTVLFSVEYLLRLFTVQRPLRYATSLYGIVDLVAILPTYLSLFIVGSQSLLVVRALRLLRVFRILKLAHYVREGRVLMTALQASRPKITIFLGFVLFLALLMGTLMYLIEGGEHGFTSIPKSIYWAIVTMTTVGYGDIAPQTVPGQFLATTIMLLGYAIIAVPTGIVSVELSRSVDLVVDNRACPSCSHEGHDSDAAFCKFCGAGLH